MGQFLNFSRIQEIQDLWEPCIEITKYFNYKPRFNGVYSRDNLPGIKKDRAYAINLNEKLSKGTH